MFHESFRVTHLKSNNAQFGTVYDREEGGVLKYSFEFSKILFSQHGQLLFAPWRGSRTKIISVFLLALSVSLLKKFFFPAFKGICEIFGSFLLPATVKFLVKPSGAKLF